MPPFLTGRLLHNSVVNRKKLTSGGVGESAGAVILIIEGEAKKSKDYLFSAWASFIGKKDAYINIRGSHYHRGGGIADIHGTEYSR